MDGILSPKYTDISEEQHNNYMRTVKIILAGAVFLASAPAFSALTLPNYISDNMIVQQNSTFEFKGKSDAGSRVCVRAGWESAPRCVTADASGKFSVAIPTPPAGGPYSVAITAGKDAVTLENVLSGEVWVCSGQSNMEFPVQGWTTVMDYDREVATAHHPDIRLLQVKKTTAFSPQEDVAVNGGGWQICSSASMADFSAIAYFFARELSQTLGVPVGVIDTTWGGTPAEAWTSAESLGSVPGFGQELADMKSAGYDRDGINKEYQKRIDEWMALAGAHDSANDRKYIDAKTGWQTVSAPGYWEQSVLPGFDGIVWMRRAIEVPADWAGKDLTLDFAAIDDEDVTYFNGVKVGSGSGYNTPRSYTVPGKLVKAGKNVITIKVSDFGGEGGVAPGVAELRNGNAVQSLQGDWQYLVQSDFSKLPAKPTDPNSSSYPSVLYNAMLYPLANMPVQGVLWYQGCANVGRAEQYEPLFQTLIKDWRKLWRADLPFYFVQLAGYLQPQAVQPDSEWAALRNAQAKALELDNTAMAVAIDLGNPVDIHPKDKQDVAHRLALIALNRDYGKDCVYQAPRCVSAKPSGKDMILKFDAPVSATSSALTGFIIAGKDGRFTTATPVLVDDHTVRLSSGLVDKPLYVRYNWADYPAGNLYGTTGLPVAPFANDR